MTSRSVFSVLGFPLLFVTTLPGSLLASDAERSLELIELVTAGRNEGLTVATSYSVYANSKKLLKMRSVTQGFTSFDVAGFSSQRNAPLKVRLLLPPLSPRGGNYVARNSVRLVLTDADQKFLADGKRLVKGLYVPVKLQQPDRTNFLSNDLPDGMAQDKWLAHVQTLGDLVAVFEFTRFKPKRQQANDKSHAPEPAAGPDSKGESSPPAR